MQIDFSAVVTQVGDLLNELIGHLPGIVGSIVLVILATMIAKLLRNLVRRLADKAHRPKSLGILLGRITRWSVISLGFVLALLIVFPDFSVGQFVQLLGLGGVAIGFAFKDIFEDFFAGILLLLNQPFDIGDQIVVDAYEGTIEDIQPRSTAIKTYDGRRVIIPNADLFTNTVIVNTAYAYRREEYEIGINFNHDIEHVRQLILDALSELPEVATDPAPDVLVMELGDFAVSLRVRWWIHPPRSSESNESRDRVLSIVKQRLMDNDIDMPFPTQRVIMMDPEKGPDPAA